MDAKTIVIMNNLNFIKNVDIYLLDQCMKGRIATSSKVLDAGFGKGRNFRFLLNQGVDVIGIDPNQEYVKLLQNEFPKERSRIIHSSIEAFSSDDEFDFIVCNAVLHFANNHQHFNEMFASLIHLLGKEGVLFIRMTSDIGLHSVLENNVDGVFSIPDGSERYLISRERIDELLTEHKLELIEPIKTVNVDMQRCMTTLVLKKKLADSR
ncbi:MAG TPA: class I SAM-dependent methyltransferase [Crocinitomicaceae bacterium]|nr:class I SAM-dependent methyltransferase [Crocinitomicaceae bacterium]